MHRARGGLSPFPAQRQRFLTAGDAQGKARAKGDGRNSKSPSAVSQSAPEGEPERKPAHNKPLAFELKNLKTDHGYFSELGLTPEMVAEFGLGYCSKGTMAGRIVIHLK